MKAVYSGRAAVALLLDQRRIYLLAADENAEPIPCRPEEVRHLIGESSDLRLVEGVTVSEVRRHLVVARDADEALHLALILLDGERQPELREEAATELEAHLATDAVRAGLEAVLSAAPSPPEIDADGAIAACEQVGAARAAACLVRLRTWQKEIRNVREAWDRIPTALFGDERERQQARAVMVREGLFRDLVAAIAGTGTVDAVLFRALQDRALGAVRNRREIVQRWAAPFRYGRRDGERPSLASEPEAEYEITDAKNEHERPLNTQEHLAHVDKSPVDIQKERPDSSSIVGSIGTNTTGFLGVSMMGPINQAVLITNWRQYVKAFGGFAKSIWLAHAIYGFFNNGGSRCFVVNVGAPGRDSQYVGEDNVFGARTGLKCFDDIDEISLIAAPGVASAIVQDALLTHCETRKDRFAILDSPKSISDDIDKLPRPRDSKYGAYYFPWVQVNDPERGRIFVPPSGHIAGVYTRTDNERGVYKAPANEVIRGVLSLRYYVSKGEQDILNPKGINCIRLMQGGGIRIWGARTLSSDPSWRYINVRRLFIMVETSIERATQWVVFEPNDHRLWKRVTRTIASFLTMVWRQGALFGETPEKAFYVKCDEETNPPETIDVGQLIVEIGMCPVKPAEFVIFRIGRTGKVEEVD